ncbi:MAG: magnesium and cobalt transport protein [Parcubacteria group bacterium Gr01-1014_31]|nr:MAG: magnesium and cobalt transport protein [Parcubacteria group bacterium Gr01-1014_31]
MRNATEIKFPRYTLVTVSNPASLDLDELARRWHFHPLDLQEAGTLAKRSRLETYADYACLVTLWPTYRRSTRDIKPVVLTFFIRTDALVVLQRGTFPVFTESIQRYAASNELRTALAERSPERLLYEILNQLYQSLFPMIDHLIDDCDVIEQEIFASHERQMISHILAIRRNITDVRKILQVHKSVLKRLATYLTENPRYAMQSTDRYFGDLIDYAKEDWDTLENLKERIEALQQTNESQISFRLSDIMKTLTIISVFTFPLTLVAAMFALRPGGGMPWASDPNGFWYVVGVQGTLALVMFFVFKRKRWF